MIQNEAPVLFVTFNRPDTTKVVFDVIRQAKPKKLYLSSDGPRQNRYHDDFEKISACRKLITDIDWDCEVKIRFSDVNQGCGPGVSSAIKWAFEDEDRLIILEDDCVPSLSFFSFCNELLEKYANDSHMMSISGTRWHEDFPIENCDYFFTRYASIWGWATWKRAWQLYDYYMSDYPEFKEKRILDIVQNENAPLIKRWTFLFDNIYNLEKKHTWDYQWQYAMYRHNGLCINATKNLVTNVGAEGMHTNDVDEFQNRERFEIDTANLQGPAFLYPEYNFDAYHGRKFFLKDRSDLKILFDHAASKFGF